MCDWLTVVVVVSGDEFEVTHNAGECHLYRDCPKNCVCDDTTVDCSGVRLTHLPETLPVHTTRL